MIEKDSETFFIELEALLGLELTHRIIFGQPLDATHDCNNLSDLELARLDFLSEVIENLRGGYNDLGIRSWFLRARVQLNGKSPADILCDNWSPSDSGPQDVLRISETLR